VDRNEEIRRRYAAGEDARKLAEEYGIYCPIAPNPPFQTSVTIERASILAHPHKQGDRFCLKLRRMSESASTAISLLGSQLIFYNSRLLDA
jgi:hypothetical protein